MNQPSRSAPPPFTLAAVDQVSSDQFSPDNGRAKFDEIGGLALAAWYVSRSGSVRMALRVANDTALQAQSEDAKEDASAIALPSAGRPSSAPLTLRKGGVLMLDPSSGVVLAIQPESFSARYWRSFSSGEKIVALDLPLKDQAVALRLANSGLQDQLQVIVDASGPKNWIKWRKLRAQRLEIDGFGAEIASHLHDLKVWAIEPS